MAVLDGRAGSDGCMAAVLGELSTSYHPAPAYFDDVEIVK
jgi:hypothetical protein